MAKKSKAWPVIGTLRKNDKKIPYIKLADNVKVFIDGEEVELNKFRTVRLEDPREKVRRLAEMGYIEESDADKRLESLAENNWLRYELVLPPPTKD